MPRRLGTRERPGSRSAHRADLDVDRSPDHRGLTLGSASVSRAQKLSTAQLQSFRWFHQRDSATLAIDHPQRKATIDQREELSGDHFVILAHRLEHI
jgi:hypothetical protein